eukprot:s572_g16.t1
MFEIEMPLKQTQRTAHTAWCPAEAGASLLALGSASVGTSASDATLDFVSFDAGRSGADMDVKASIRMEGGRRFSTISWGRLGSETSFPMGCVAGGLQDGIVSLWNPNVILNSNGSDQGVINTLQVHKGTVNCVEFHPLKSTLMATCGDSEVKILNIESPSSPNLFEPSTNNKHLGSEVLSCAWNRVVPHILCSSSNTGTTVQLPDPGQLDVTCTAWCFAGLSSSFTFLDFTTATQNQRRRQRRLRAKARLAWFLHRRGFRLLGQTQLHRLWKTLGAHHSRDRGHLAAICAAMTTMKTPEWKCRTCKKLLKGHMPRCAWCGVPWQQCYDANYVCQEDQKRQKSSSRAYHEPEGQNRHQPHQPAPQNRETRHKSPRNSSRRHQGKGQGHQQETYAAVPTPQVPFVASTTVQ